MRTTQTIFMNYKHKILFSVIILFAIAMVPNAQAIGDCEMGFRDVPIDGMQIIGYVSTMGHFASNLSIVDFPHALFCSELLAAGRTDGGETIYFSDPNAFVLPGMLGSGHVSLTNASVSFGATESLGFEVGQCRTVSGGDPCNASEVCVFKISDPEQGHIADCNVDNTPMPNLYQHRLCCTPTEYCRDGRDNTGDGLIDCASPECHQSPINFEPQQCNPEPEYLLADYGNWQNTSGCVIGNTGMGGGFTTIYNSSCIGPRNNIAFESGWGLGLPWPQGFPDQYDFPDVNASYYCSYGINDDGSQTGGEGFCCPTGTRAQYDEDLDMWECRDFEECGMDASRDCDDNYRFDNWAGWVRPNCSSCPKHPR